MRKGRGAEGLLEAVFLDLAVEGALANAEDAGGLDTVAADHAQGVLDELAL